MAYTPVISQEENVVIIKCPGCKGSVMSFVERFAGNRDLEDLEDFRERGFSISTIPVRRLGVQTDCACSSPGTVQTISPSVSVSPRPKAAPTGKPLLKLPKRP